MWTHRPYAGPGNGHWVERTVAGVVEYIFVELDQVSHPQARLETICAALTALDEQIAVGS